MKCPHFSKNIFSPWWKNAAIKENELLNSLNPIIQSNSLWKDTVSDYIKKYYLARGEFNKAKDFEASSNEWLKLSI